MTSENEIVPSATNQTRAQRILIVDDEPIMAIMLRIVLEQLPDCEVLSAGTGEDALRRTNGKPLDLLITDYNLPGIDGLTLATQLRQLQPELPIIVITAATHDDRLHHRATALSIHNILDKPVDLDKLKQLTTEFLDRVDSRVR